MEQKLEQTKCIEGTGGKNQYGPGSTENGFDSTRKKKNFKKILSNNDEDVNAKIQAIGENYAVIQNEALKENKQLPDTFKSPNGSQKNNCPVNSNSSGEKKKKNRTPPKQSFNGSNGNNRINQNKKGSFNFQGSEQDSLIDSPLFALTPGNVKTGSKKNNLNYLLNFSYESPRDSNENYEYQKFSKQFWSNKIAKSSYFSKEQFLQANCQFVVKNTGDYSVHMIDPDQLVDWKRIEEIHIDSHEIISCPICLYPPQAGKMTKCGHIYCWSCILHYLSLSDKAWRKCPICFESIYKDDLKSVVQNKYDSHFKVGDSIEFELMFKSKSKLNTVILPYSLNEQFNKDVQKHKALSFNLFNGCEYASGRKYFKILSKSCEEIQKSVLDREERELKKQKEEDNNQPEVCFVDEAMNILLERVNALKSEDSKKLSPTRKKSQEKIEISEKLENLAIEGQEISDSDVKAANENPSSAKKNVQQSALNDSQDFVYFYQSIDGQRVYLNALNARMMMSEYSAFTNCPQKLKAKVIASECFFMSEENRKRFRYLSHLPLHSEFKIVEIDLKEPYVTKETIQLFEEEISEKKRIRERKLAKEKRLADRWDQSIYDPHYYNTSAMNEPQIFSNNSITDYSSEFPEASTSPSASSSGISSGGSTQSKENTEQTPTSFAQMIRHPVNNLAPNRNNSIEAWPSLENNANMKQSQLTNGWLCTAKAGPTLGRTKKVQGPPSPWTKNSLVDYENEQVEEVDYIPAPVYKESFFSAIDESLREIDSRKMKAWEESLLAEDKDGDERLKVPKQQIKKKKKTKQLLFSTH